MLISKCCGGSYAMNEVSGGQFCLCCGQQEGMNMTIIDSTTDERTVNNVMRHGYRVLTDGEKQAMQKIKDDGLAMWSMIDGIGASRELSIAKTKIEEAVMWAVKHVTA